MFYYSCRSNVNQEIAVAGLRSFSFWIVLGCHDLGVFDSLECGGSTPFWTAPKPRATIGSQVCGVGETLGALLFVGALRFMEPKLRRAGALQGAVFRSGRARALRCRAIERLMTHLGEIDRTARAVPLRDHSRHSRIRTQHRDSGGGLAGRCK